MDIIQVLLEIIRKRELGLGSRKKAQVIVCAFFKGILENIKENRGKENWIVAFQIEGRELCVTEMERGLGREQECYRRGLKPGQAVSLFCHILSIRDIANPVLWGTE